MTTIFERLRSPLGAIGVVLIVMGAYVIASSLYFRGQDSAQKECLTRNFSSLADTLSVRGSLTQKEGRASRVEGRASRWESLANQDFYADIVNGGTAEAFTHAYARYGRRVGLANAERVRAAAIRERVKAIREDNPFPAFPAGTCE